MRDLFFLSEVKLRNLAAQLPDRVIRRLGVELGLNAGVASLRVSLPAQRGADPRLLERVIAMFETETFPRWRTESDLQPGDWIQFDEQFTISRRVPNVPYSVPAGDFVYFQSVDRAERFFVLCGSERHIVERGYVQQETEARQSLEKLTRTLGGGHANTDKDKPTEQARVTPPAPQYIFSGHARILASYDDLLLATPLYVEYGSRDRRAP